MRKELIASMGRKAWRKIEKKGEKISLKIIQHIRPLGKKVFFPNGRMCCIIFRDIFSPFFSKKY